MWMQKSDLVLLATKNNTLSYSYIKTRDNNPHPDELIFTLDKNKGNLTLIEGFIYSDGKCYTIQSKYSSSSKVPFFEIYLPPVNKNITQKSQNVVKAIIRTYVEEFYILKHLFPATHTTYRHSYSISGKKVKRSSNSNEKEKTSIHFTQEKANPCLFSNTNVNKITQQKVPINNATVKLDDFESGKDDLSDWVIFQP